MEFKNSSRLREKKERKKKETESKRNEKREKDREQVICSEKKRTRVRRVTKVFYFNDKKRIRSYF